MLMTMQYSAKNIAELEPVVDGHVNRWLLRLNELYAQSGKVFDYAPWTSYLAYDVISDIAFGAPLGFIDTGSDVADLIKGLHTGWALFGFLARCYPFKDYLGKSWVMKKLLIPSKNANSGFDILLRTRDRLLKERCAKIAEGRHQGRQDMLQAILDARDEDGKPLDLGTVKQETLNILIAGAETTGTTLQTLLQTLLHHPSPLARCVAKIRIAQQNGRLGTSVPTITQVHMHLPFYIACLRETMRLYPPLPKYLPTSRVIAGSGTCGR